jgi:hypothetical protein
MFLNTLQKMFHIRQITVMCLGVCDYRWEVDWILHLLTTCIHHSELQVITSPLLISKIHKSPQHPLSLFAACCVFNSRSLVIAYNGVDPSVPCTQVLITAACAELPLNWQLN